MKIETKIILAVSSILIFLSIILISYKYKNTVVIPPYTPTTEKTYINNDLLRITRVDLKEDLDLYPEISSTIKKIILDEVIATSTKYNINPVILYSLLHVESSMRFWVEHNPVTQVINGKKIKTNAIGLGGVIWEWYSADLIKEGIAVTKSDLYLPSNNIKATGYIYSIMYKRAILKGANHRTMSALMRYFGGSYKSYFEKIDTKIGTIISRKLYKDKK